MTPTGKPGGNETATWRQIRVLALFPAVLAFLAGCASVDPGPSFQEVKADIENRTGRHVHWYRGTAEDEAAEKQVRKMLQGELDVNEAVQVALLNNRRLQAVYEELGVAQAELVRAGLLTNPVFEGVMRFDDEARPAVDLGVTTEFISILMIPLRRRVAAAELEETKLHVTARVMEVARQVATEFYRQQAALQARKMRKTVLDATGASFMMARRLHEAGNMTDLALSRQRSAHERARLDLSAAELAVAESRERLNTLMGLWGKDTDWTVAPRLPDVPSEGIPLEKLERHAIEKSLELAMTRRKVEAAAGRAGMANVTSIIPELEAGAEGEGEPSGHWQVGPAVSFPVPLFHQGGPARARAGAELRRAWEAYTATAIEVRSAARTARHRLLTTRQRAIYYRDVILPLQKKIMHQTQLRYNGMFVGVFELLQTKQQEIEARRRYIEELRNYWIARTELEQVLNGHMVEGSAVSISAGAGMGSTGGGH